MQRLDGLLDSMDVPSCENLSAEDQGNPSFRRGLLFAAKMLLERASEERECWQWDYGEGIARVLIDLSNGGATGSLDALLDRASGVPTLEELKRDSTPVVDIEEAM